MQTKLRYQSVLIVKIEKIEFEIRHLLYHYSLCVFIDLLNPDETGTYRIYDSISVPHRTAAVFLEYSNSLSVILIHWILKQRWKASIIRFRICYCVCFRLSTNKYFWNSYAESRLRVLSVGTSCSMKSLIRSIRCNYIWFMRWISILFM